MAKKLGVSQDAIFGQISSEMSIETNAGEGSLQTLNVDDIDVDPMNARKKGRISPTEIRDHLAKTINLAKSSDLEKKVFFEALLELSSSIDIQNLLHPIIVVVDGDRYRIRAGERRYLAHILLKKKFIRAFVRPRFDDPFSDRAVPLIENLQRENLSTGELIAEVNKLDSIFPSHQDRKMSAKNLSELIHKSERTCQVYIQLARAPEPIYEKLLNNELTINEARGLLSAENIQINDRENSSPTGDPKSPARRGPKRNNINLGKVSVKNIQAIRHIISIVEGERHQEESYTDADWGDAERVQSIWDLFLNEIIEGKHG